MNHLLISEGQDVHICLLFALLHRKIVDKQHAIVFVQCHFCGIWVNADFYDH